MQYIWEGFDEIKNIFVSIIPQEELMIAFGRTADDTDENLLRYNATLRETKVHVMSDSIVIAAPVGAPEALTIGIDICNVI